MKTPEELRTLLRYEPSTGKLFWRDVGSPQRRAKYAGKEAFTANDGNGYRQSRIDGEQYRAHRVIWAMVHGAWPAQQVDHINGDRADNRLCNLRSATSSQNGANRRRVRGSSIFLGVCLHKQSGRWTAHIQKNGRRRYLGIFPTESAAHEAYAAAAQEAHGEYAAA